MVLPANYEFHLVDPATVAATKNVISPWTNDRLHAKWVKGTRIAYIGLAGNTMPSSLRKRLKDLLRHAAGETTDRGPHRGGEILWQLAGYERFTIMAMATEEPPAPRTLEQKLLARFRERHGALPFGNREPGEAETNGRVAPTAPRAVLKPTAASTEPATIAIEAEIEVENGTKPAAQISTSTPIKPSPKEVTAGAPSVEPPAKKSALSIALEAASAGVQGAIVLSVWKDAPGDMTVGAVIESLTERGFGEAFMALKIGELRGDALSELPVTRIPGSTRETKKTKPR